jgi:hypothetical protein
MFVLHLNWSHGSLRVWGENANRLTPAQQAPIAPGTHPFAATAEDLRTAIAPAIEHARASAGGDERIGAEGTISDSSISLLLPYVETPNGQLPLPSDRLAACDEAAGFMAEAEEALVAVEVPAGTTNARSRSEAGTVAKLANAGCQR